MILECDRCKKTGDSKYFFKFHGEDLCIDCNNKAILDTRVQDIESLKQNRINSDGFDLCFKDLLFKYVGEFIGVNYDNPSDYGIALLLSTNNEYFSISTSLSSGLIYHYPYSAIMSVAQTVSDEIVIKNPADCKLLVQVQRLVVYKGASGVIIPLPL